VEAAVVVALDDVLLDLVGAAAEAQHPLNRIMQQRAGEVVDLSILHSIVAVGTDDLMEGTTAMKERRPGNFTGR
jgi:hypothetical protein